MEYVISAFWFALEFIGFHFLLSAFFSRKRSIGLYLVHWLALWIIYILIAILELPKPVELVLYFSGYCAICVIHYHAPVLQILLVASVSYLFAAIFESLVLYGVCSVLRISLADFVWRKLQYTSVVTMAKLLYIL